MKKVLVLLSFCLFFAVSTSASNGNGNGKIDRQTNLSHSSSSVKGNGKVVKQKNLSNSNKSLKGADYSKKSLKTFASGKKYHRKKGHYSNK